MLKANRKSQFLQRACQANAQEKRNINERKQKYKRKKASREHSIYAMADKVQ